METQRYLDAGWRARSLRNVKMRIYESGRNKTVSGCTSQDRLCAKAKSSCQYSRRYKKVTERLIGLIYIIRIFFCTAHRQLKRRRTAADRIFAHCIDRYRVTYREQADSFCGRKEQSQQNYQQAGLPKTVHRNNAKRLSVTQ